MNEISRPSRNYGIDIMRIMSMLMIVINHILGHGGVIEALAPCTIKFEAFWLLKTFCYGGVDCFALISGYVGYGSKHKYRQIIELSLQVMFYTLIITLAFFLLIDGSVTAKTVLKSIFPISYNVYWYFSSYFLMFFLMPYIDKFVLVINESCGKKLIIICIILFSVFPTIFCYDIGAINKGYSTIWLCLLYLIGAIFRKNSDTFSCCHNYKYCGWYYFVLCFVTWSVRLIIEWISIRITGTVLFETWLLSYNSPTILIGSICLLVLFSNIKVEEKYRKLVLSLSGASFGVYLLHEEPLIREYIISKVFMTQINRSGVLLLLIIIGASGGIYLVGAFLEKFRKWIFKVFRISSLCIKIEELLDGIFKASTEQFL